VTALQVSSVEEATAGLAPVALDAVLALAELQTRTDRKYLVEPEAFTALAGALAGGMAALEIDGRRSFRYESAYFDTPDLEAYHGAARGRRRRFKVRTRAYLDSGDCMLEVKVRGGRGETVKYRTPYELSDHGHLTAQGLAFVAEHVDLSTSCRLAPVLVTSYQRTTLVDLAAGTRLTCDAGLTCTAGDAAPASLPRHVLIETKSLATSTAADRMLWRAGHRPVSLSKFCLGLATLHPELPANQWNLVLRRYFGWAPAPR